MLKTNFKKLIFLILISACVAGVSGCVRKTPKKPVVNNNTQPVNQNLNVNTNTNINTPAQNGDGEEIDTSDWQTYINTDEGCFFSHPSDLIINKTTNSSSSRLTLTPENYQGDGKGVPTYDEIKEGFKIAIIIRKVYEKPTKWTDFVEMPSGSIGKRIYRNTEFNLGDKVVYKSVQEGKGFLDEYSDVHVLTFFAMPNSNEDKIVEIWLLSKKIENDKYIDIFNEIVKSFEWKE